MIVASKLAREIYYYIKNIHLKENFWYEKNQNIHRINIVGTMRGIS